MQHLQQSVLFTHSPGVIASLSSSRPPAGLTEKFSVCLQFTVLTGHSQEQLVSEGSPIKWCGWHQVLKDPRVCRFKLSPLQDQYLAVDPAKSGGILPGESYGCVIRPW